MYSALSVVARGGRRHVITDTKWQFTRNLYEINRPVTYALTNDESSFVAWHPDVPFPYEMTKPLPVGKLDHSTFLRQQFSPKMMEIFNKKTDEMAIAELAAITHTCKNLWYQRPSNWLSRECAPERPYL